MTDTDQTTPPMRLNVKVKVVASGDFHRFALTGSPGPDYDALTAKIAEIAKTAFGGSDLEYKIFYTDDEDDLCVLASQEDLLCALTFLPTPQAPLRLTLEQLDSATAKSNPVAPVEQTVQPHSRRWYTVRGMTPPAAEPQLAWHKWATAKFGPMPERRLAAAWAITPGQAVEKLAAAMDGNLAAYTAIEAALQLDEEHEQPNRQEDAAAEQPEPTEGDGGWDGGWGIHQGHHHPPHDGHHHGWGKGLKGKGGGHMKGKHMHMKGKMKGMMLVHEMYGTPPPPDMMGTGHDWHGWGKGCKGKGGHHAHRGGRGHHGWGGRGGGGPAHKLAEALGIDKHQAWAILKSAAAGDPVAQAQIQAVLGEESEAKLDADWMEAKLAKKAEKMAGKSEILAQKAAWFAASGKEKDQKKAAKLLEKAAKVEAKGQDFQKMAAGMLSTPVSPPAGATPGAQPPTTAVVETVDAAAAHPSMAAIESVTIVAGETAAAPAAAAAVDSSAGGGEAAEPPIHHLGTDVRYPDSCIELVAVDEAEAGDESAAAAAAAAPAEEEPLVPPEWQAALENMTAMMGFPAEAAAQALKDHDGNVQYAISTLIG